MSELERFSKIFPKDWGITTFIDACDLITDYTAAGSFASLKENINYLKNPNYARLIRLTDLRKKLKSTVGIYLNKEGYDFLKKSNLRHNDIMIANVGEYTGFSCLMPKYSMPATIAPNMFLVRPSDEFNPIFVNNYMNLQYFQTEVDKISASSATKLLNKTNFRKMFLPKPALEEQNKVAEILTSVDKVIELTEIEIEKLKNLKKGMMQDLLTRGIGHTKFKDSPVGKIPESWEVKKLGGISNVKASNVDKKTKQGESPVLLCNYMDVYRNEYILRSIDFMQSSASPSELEKFTLLMGDVVITKDSETPDDIGIPTYIDQNIPNLVCGYHLYKISPTMIAGEFLSYYLGSSYVQNTFYKLASGSTRFGINLHHVTSLLVAVPTEEEQVKIIKSIRSINNNIEGKTKKLFSFKNIKKGLMQDLLTGKVRVKV